MPHWRPWEAPTLPDGSEVSDSGLFLVNIDRLRAVSPIRAPNGSAHHYRVQVRA
jgi:hypothetical protein